MFPSGRKKSYCQNCQYPLTSNYNFCPQCGQENNDKLVSFGTLIGEFLTNYFSYDSRLLRTIKPFLFKPGFLTKEYIAGRRVHYMHPLRLYLIISFIYFVFLSFVISHEMEDGQQKVLNFNNVQAILDEEGQENPEPFEENATFKEGPVSNERESIDTTTTPGMPTSNTSIVMPGNNIFAEKLSILQKEGVTPEEVVESWEFKNNAINYIIAKQSIRFANESKERVLAYLIKNTSIMMFFLLPFFALILKLLYIRRNRYYIEHITFTLHIHAFIFFLLVINMGINYFWPNDWSFALLFLLSFIYLFIGFLNVYQQKWRKTLGKMVLLFLSYFIFTFTVFSFLLITISFLFI